MAITIEMNLPDFNAYVVIKAENPRIKHRFHVNLKKDIDLSTCPHMTDAEKAETVAAIEAAIDGQTINDLPDNDPPLFAHNMNWETLRGERDRLLTSTDWQTAPDSPDMTDAQATYRQALRDLPSTSPDDVTKISFPDPPS